MVASSPATAIARIDCESKVDSINVAAIKLIHSGSSFLIPCDIPSEAINPFSWDGSSDVGVGGAEQSRRRAQVHSDRRTETTHEEIILITFNQGCPK